MAPKSLIKTNPYLKDPDKRRTLFIATVSSSTAIEGVHTAVDDILKISRKPVKPIAAPESEGSGGSRH